MFIYKAIELWIFGSIKENSKLETRVNNNNNLDI